MPHQLLDRPNISAILQQVRRKRMPERVTCHTLSYFRSVSGIMHRPLNLRLVKMVTPYDTGRVAERPRRREKIEPLPFGIRIGKLASQRAIDASHSNAATPIRYP